MTLTVACVKKQGPLYSARYVNILRAMVARHLPAPHEFVCLTDDPRGLAKGIRAVPLTAGLQGFWAKLELFKPGQFTGRCLYLDLDCVVVGPLAGLAAHPGIIDLQTWGWKTPTYGSGTMVWDAGEHSEIWERFTPDVPKRLRGDQDWLTELGGWGGLPAEMNRSYRYHCRDGIPAGCRVVHFHGAPKMADVKDAWVARHWREAA